MKSVHALIFFINKIVELVYPNQCLICGKLKIKGICNKCYNELKIKPQIIIYKNKSFKEHLYIFEYKGIIRKLILNYKFNDKAYLNELFVKIILKNEKICRKIKKYDIIMPVPIHRARKRQRGYDQSEIIARKIADYFEEIKLNIETLKKEKNTIAQSSLTKEQRQQNVKQVYKIENKEKIENKRVILFDDIYTTGSTAEECARLLKENGAKEVLVFTLAKD